jgi:uncharacterized membrane protein
MTTFSSSKILAGIGSLLYGTIVGLILFMIGVKGLSEHYKDRRIYDGLVMGVVLLIISGILTGIGMSVLWFTVFAGLGLLGMGLGNYNYYDSYYGGSYGMGAMSASVIIGIVGMIVCFIIAFILALLAVRHIKNCFHALAERSGKDLFRTAGTLIWVGAILTIIGVGFFLIWIGFIIAAVGFFTLEEKPLGTTNSSTPPPYGYTSTSTQQQQQQQPPVGSKPNFCQNCGTAVASGNTFCPKCGKQI